MHIIGKKIRPILKKTLTWAGRLLLVFLSIEISLLFVSRVYLFYYLNVASHCVSVNENAYRILCLGESTTEGWAGDDNYPRQLEILLSRKYPHREFQVINRGVACISSADIHRHFERNIRLTRPHLIILHVGNNPTGLAGHFFLGDNIKHGERLSAFLNSFRAFRTGKLFVQVAWALYFDLLELKNMYADFYLRGMSEFYYVTQEMHEEYIGMMKKRADEKEIPMIMCNYFKSQANTFLPQIASKHNLPLCDIREIRLEYEEEGRIEDILGDGWHPNRLGYTRIAQKLLETIEREIVDLESGDEDDTEHND